MTIAYLCILVAALLPIVCAGIAKAGIKVLSSLVRASASTAYLAVYGFMDQMIKMFADPEDMAQRTPILASPSLTSTVSAQRLSGRQCSRRRRFSC